MLQFKQISMRLGLVVALILVLLAMMVLNTYPVNARPYALDSDNPIQSGGDEEEEEDEGDEEDELDLGGDEEEEDTDQQDEEDEDEDEDEDDQDVPDLEDIDLTDDPDDVIDELRANDFLTTNRTGKLLFTIPPNGATFLRSTFIGLTYLPMGRNKTAENFVLYTTLEWQDAGKDSQCGIGFRWRQDAVSYVLLGNDGTINVSAEEDNDVTDSIQLNDEDGDWFSPEDINSLVLIADTDDIQVFLNSRYLGTLEAIPTDGTFLVLLINQEGNRKRTHCIFREGWVWTFDS